MARLIVLVEGETEEGFIKEVLSPHLYARGYRAVSARLLGPASERSRRGGIIGWQAARRDIVRHLRQDRTWLVTTMVDYYGLPRSGVNAWPGRAEAGGLPFPQKAPRVQKAVRAAIVKEMGRSFDRGRFLPFVMMHEYEALLFSDCERFANGIGRPELAPAFQAIRDEFTSPEEINDRPQHTPSKRIARLMAEYQKPLHGVFAAEYIGLDAIGAECPHFRTWFEALEAWSR